MSILSIRRDWGVDPSIVRVNTDDDLSTITTNGYLSDQAATIKSLNNGAFDWKDNDLVAIHYSDGEGFFRRDSSNNKFVAEAGDVVLPTRTNYLAHFTGADGEVSSDAADVINEGDIQAGQDASAGKLVSFPSTTASGSFEFEAVDSSTDSTVTVSNADFGQASVISIPDPGAATANFLLDDGAANLLAHQQFVGLESVIAESTGTWTVTRVARGDYVLRHTEADETTILGIDVTPMIRTASSKGFRLDSFDVMYAINDGTLDAHTVTLDRVEYADNVAVSVNSISITGSLATATQANPYVTNVAVDSPAFDNTANSKYVIEVTVDNAATSEYDFIGVMLRFTETVA